MKWYGQIAFMDQVEEEPDVFVEKPVERTYIGDLVKASRSAQSSNSINPNLTLSNELSVIYDPYMQENLYKILYVTVGGAKWKVSNATIQPPRITLSLSELYTEEET